LEKVSRGGNEAAKNIGGKGNTRQEREGH